MLFLLLSSIEGRILHFYRFRYNQSILIFDLCLHSINDKNVSLSKKCGVCSRLKIANEQQRFLKFSSNKHHNIMYNIIVNSSIYDKINHYGELFFGVFLTRFSDTGMGEAEKIIQKQYLEVSDALVDGIIDGMISTISRDFIYHTPLES